MRGERKQCGVSIQPLPGAICAEVPGGGQVATSLLSCTQCVHGRDRTRLQIEFAALKNTGKKNRRTSTEHTCVRAGSPAPRCSNEGPMRSNAANASFGQYRRAPEMTAVVFMRTFLCKSTHRLQCVERSPRGRMAATTAIKSTVATRNEDRTAELQIQ